MDKVGVDGAIFISAFSIGSQDSVQAPLTSSTSIIAGH
jgi:hypothetical protein